MPCTWVRSVETGGFEHQTHALEEGKEEERQARTRVPHVTRWDVVVGQVRHHERVAPHEEVSIGEVKVNLPCHEPDQEVARGIGIAGITAVCHRRSPQHL